MNHQHRRQFLRSLVLAGATLYFPACKRDKPNPSPTPNPMPPAPDTLKKVEEIVEQMEEDFKSQNVLFLRPANEQYADLNIGFNKRITRQPKIIALPQNVEGVSEAVRYAKQFKLPVAVKSGGHSFEGFSSNDGGMCINLSLFKNIDWIDDDTVKMGSGVKLFETYDALLPKGKILPAGSCATVGIAGLVLGGGYGLFARKFGLTCDSLLGLTMVDGDGKIHRVEGEDELMWANRGGNNGNFGVVTDFTF
ncbi:MAG: FAD-dependent oxidoreductase, partial [Saprospiraceae bacterium]